MEEHDPKGDQDPEKLLRTLFLLNIGAIFLLLAILGLFSYLNIL